MFIVCRYDTHIVPTGLKRVETAFFYKHIVPTGLKTLPQRIYTLKLTLMVRLFTTPIGVNLRKHRNYYDRFS